jgi:hypothetical protein
MKHPYTIQVKLRPGGGYLDLFDWLEQQKIEFGEDWAWDNLRPAEFRFAKPEHATMFALRWA